MIKEISYQIIGEIKDRCKSLDDATLIKIIEKIKGAKSIFSRGSAVLNSPSAFLPCGLCIWDTASIWLEM